MELNPHHPTTKSVHEHWHKICAILMHKLKLDHEVITLADMKALPDGLFIVVQELSDGLHLRLVDEQTAKNLAKQHGGITHGPDE